MEREGFVDRPGEPPVELVLQRIREMEQTTANPERRDVATRTEVGFFRLGIDEMPGLAFTPSAVPAELVEPDSNNYLRNGGNSIDRVYTKTTLGTLLIREKANAVVHNDAFESGRFTIAGFPALTITERYGRGYWVTRVLTQKGTTVVEVQVGTRIETPQEQAQLETLVRTLLYSP
jgi:hypothetical protein